MAAPVAPMVREPVEMARNGETDDLLEQRVIARAGLNYHFNWGAAPVPRY